MKCPNNHTQFLSLGKTCIECPYNKECRNGEIEFLKKSALSDILEHEGNGVKPENPTLTVTTPKSRHPYDSLDINTLVKIFNEYKKTTLEGIIEMGSWLLYMKESKRWKEYGVHLESFEDFKKELNEDRTTLGYCMQIASIGHLLNGIDLGFKRLTQVLPLLRDKTDIEKREILEYVGAGHTPDNFQQALRVKKGLEPCEHKTTELWVKCTDICNKFLGKAR